MNRRKLITLLGGAAAAWPLAARAQQREKKRRIGVLMNLSDNGPEGRLRIEAFRQGLENHGRTEGRNIQIEYRRTGSSPERARAYAAELVAMDPEVIFAAPTFVVAALQRETRTVPVVFAQVNDPVGAGFVSSLARPGGNMTGFALLEFAMGAKCVELLKQMSPSVTRAIPVFGPKQTARTPERRTDRAVKRAFYRLAVEPRETILVARSKCDWRAAFSRDELIASHGADYPKPAASQPSAVSIRGGAADAQSTQRPRTIAG